MRVHTEFHIRITALKEEARTINAIVSSRLQEQDQDYRTNMMKGVCKATKADADVGRC